MGENRKNKKIYKDRIKIKHQAGYVPINKREGILPFPWKSLDIASAIRETKEKNGSYQPLPGSAVSPFYPCRLHTL